METLQPFLAAFPPLATRPLPPEQLARLQATAPPLLGQLWQQPGLGLYADGLLQLIDPERFRPVLAEWLGGDKPHYTPFAISAFGDLFYHRQLTPNDEDVCRLDPHYRSIIDSTWSLESFFNKFLLTADIVEQVLRRPLFTAALASHGPLPPSSIYCFTPALILGGRESADSLKVGDAATHLSLLYQMGA